MHSHVIELGDHPSVSHGPPITLGREIIDSCKLSVDDYESRLEGRRSKRELILPGALREDWLRELGYSRNELIEAVSVVKKIKVDRRSSAEDGKLWEKLRKWTHTHKQTLDLRRDAKNDRRTSAEDGRLWEKLRKWTHTHKQNLDLRREAKNDRRSSADDGKRWEKLRKWTHTHKQNLNSPTLPLDHAW
jgi:hypothetical protein